MRGKVDPTVEMGEVLHLVPRVRAGPTEPGAPCEGVPVDHPRAEEIAAYIADLAAELIVLARKTGFDTLASVLTIARKEAQLRAGLVE